MLWSKLGVANASTVTLTICFFPSCHSFLPVHSTLLSLISLACSFSWQSLLVSYILCKCGYCTSGNVFRWEGWSPCTDFEVSMLSVGFALGNGKDWGVTECGGLGKGGIEKNTYSGKTLMVNRSLVYTQESVFIFIVTMRCWCKLWSYLLFLYFVL
jgi:hypothetical protein